MSEEIRIYVAVASSIQVPVTPNSHKPPLRTVIQPAGRQIAQACHVVSKLRINTQKGRVVTLDGFANELLNGPHTAVPEFEPITTIILQARDSAELGHVFTLLHRKRLNPVMFSDDNPEYGPGSWPTAIAVYATKKQTKFVLDYLPMWSGK